MKYITKYPEQATYFSDVAAEAVAIPNVTWAVDTDTVHYLYHSKLIYYGHIPKSVVITDWSTITPFQIRFYLNPVIYTTTNLLEINALEGDKLVILYPSWIETGGIYKDDGFGGKSVFSTEIFGCNGEPLVSMNNSEYKVFGEIVTVSGLYKVGIENIE